MRRKPGAGSVGKKIEEAQAAATQAKADYEMHLKGYRKEDIAAAQTDVDRATADETRARLDFQRYEATGAERSRLQATAGHKAKPIGKCRSP